MCVCLRRNNNNNNNNELYLHDYNNTTFQKRRRHKTVLQRRLRHNTTLLRKLIPEPKDLRCFRLNYDFLVAIVNSHHSKVLFYANCSPNVIDPGELDVGNLCCFFFCRSGTAQKISSNIRNLVVASKTKHVLQVD